MKWLESSKAVASLFVLMVLAVGVLVIQVATDRANAQQQVPRAAKADVGNALFDPTDVVLLLLDHQTGLFQTVKDISVAELRANTALAKVATLMKVPVITTASVPDGPNGPLMPEIHQFAPHAVFVPRKGEISA